MCHRLLIQEQEPRHFPLECHALASRHTWVGSRPGEQPGCGGKVGGWLPVTTDGPDPAAATDAPDPAAVIEAFGLPGPVTGWEPVGGAWSNRVYRLDTGGPLATGGRRYAVKEMRNPWAEPRWQEWLAESWSFEQRAIAAGIAAPQPVPNPVDGTCLAWVSRFGNSG